MKRSESWFPRFHGKGGSICSDGQPVWRPRHELVLRFLEAGVLDAEVFEAILRGHALMEKWQTFQATYLEP